jgi:hypothetical protein
LVLTPEATQPGADIPCQVRTAVGQGGLLLPSHGLVGGVSVGQPGTDIPCQVRTAAGQGGVQVASHGITGFAEFAELSVGVFSNPADGTSSRVI